MTPDHQFLAIASRQHGCATIAQGRSCGLTPDQLYQRIRDGRFERLGHHVLRVRGSAPSWEQQLTAALLDLGPRAVLSHRSAAALYGFDGFGRGPVELTMPRIGRGRSSIWTLHTTRRLDLIDREDAGPFRRTSAARTIVDLAPHVSTRELERAIDSAVRDGYVSPWFLRERLDALRGRGRRGVPLLDRLLEDAGGHSDLERRFLVLVRKAGLPRPRCQRIFRRDGVTLARADFSFEPAPVIAEVNGRRGHASDAERAKDARRRNELELLGFVVIEFTYRQVYDDPGYVVGMLRRHLERAVLVRPIGLTDGTA